MIASILRTQLGDCLPESAISSGIQGGGIKTGAISRTDLKINRTQASDFFIIWVYLYHTTTQMRYLLFVVIGLIGCFPLRAQTPEDNLRDEEYYPFQNGYAFCRFGKQSMTNQDMFLCLKVCGRTTNNILKKSMRKVLVTTISSPIPEKAATIQPQSTTGFGMRYGIVELRIKDVDTVRGFMTFVIPLPFVLCKS